MKYFVKFIVVGLLIFGYQAGMNWYSNSVMESHRDVALRQFENDDEVAAQVRLESQKFDFAFVIGGFVVAAITILLFREELGRMFKKVTPVLLFVLPLCSGCMRPFEPVKLEIIQANEEAFMLPLIGDTKKQTSSNSEDYLRENLVFTKQVKIPQQWVQTGRMDSSGDWRDAAMVIKVDKSPVTREWTADPNSGTSNKNEAIWVMTSDQVEFSTGWTCTARIATRDDAVKFLHNYPNGALEKVMDTEIRAKLQATFGLEVTDLPMDTLRKSATPHLKATVDNVIEFFQSRGITITNLGITGGFVYKDQTIIDTMVKVFNAEQEKSIAKAATDAQDERNKKVELEAKGKANALLTERKAEAEGIRAVAEAKAYEIEKAAENPETYLALKRIELEKEKLARWDGKFPITFMGGNSPDMLLNVQIPEVAKSESKK